MPANRYPTTQALIDDLMEFLAARVPMNHNARLVMYLREIGEVAPTTRPRRSSPRARRAHPRAGATDRRMVRIGGDRPDRSSASRSCASGGAIQAASGRFTGTRDDFAAATGAPVVPAPRRDTCASSSTRGPRCSIDGQKVVDHARPRARIPLRRGPALPEAPQPVLPRGRTARCGSARARHETMEVVLAPLHDAGRRRRRRGTGRSRRPR